MANGLGAITLDLSRASSAVLDVPRANRKVSRLANFSIAVARPESVR